MSLIAFEICEGEALEVCVVKQTIDTRQPW